MTTDFRALCVELTDCLEKADWPNRYKVVFQQWTDVARAALAEPDGPAVPEGREPASVATQPSDEEIEEWADACPEAPLEEMDPEVHGWRRCFTAKEFSETIRAAIARWGRPTPQPPADGDASTVIPWLLEMAVMAANSDSPYSAGMLTLAAQLIGEGVDEDAPSPPVDGEVADLVAALKVIDKMQHEWILLGNDDGTASPSLSMPISLRRFTVLRDALFRAATLLQQQTAPVRVSERLPGPEDCDEQGRCWLYGNVKGDWRLIDPNNSGVPQLKYCFSHWLPANALPLPAPESGEVSCER